MKLKVVKSTPAPASLEIQVDLIDDSAPDTPTLDSQTFVFVGPTPPEDAATEIQRRFAESRRQHESVSKLAAAFPVGLEMEVVTRQKALEVLGLA